MRGKKTDLGQADCAIARSLHVIGDWWSLLLIREAFIGSQRFGEFQKSLGLAKNILAARLRKLVDEGIFSIEPDGGSTRRHRYVLTEKGERLYVVIVSLWQWGEEFCFEPGELSLAIVDNMMDRPLAVMRPRAEDGVLIGPRDFRLVSKPGAAAEPKGLSA